MVLRCGSGAGSVIDERRGELIIEASRGETCSSHWPSLMMADSKLLENGGPGAFFARHHCFTASEEVQVCMAPRLVTRWWYCIANEMLELLWPQDRDQSPKK